MHDVITIGTATVDAFIHAPFLKAAARPTRAAKGASDAGKANCFPSGAKIEIGEPFMAVGGGAFNSAVTFARSELSTAALIKVGGDLFGSFIIQHAHNENVSPISLWDSSKSTGLSFVLLNKEGERTIMVHRGCSGDMKKEDIPFGKLQARWAYVAPGSMPLATVRAIADYCYERSIAVAINPSRDLIDLGIQKLRPILAKTRVVIMNREEASALTGVAYSKKHAIFAELDRHVLGIAVMTDGINGALVSDGRYIFESGSFREKIVTDKTGAGDAFGSGFVTGLIETGEEGGKNACNPESIAYALKRGAANATSVIEHLGATAGILRKKDFCSQRRWNALEATYYPLKKK